MERKEILITVVGLLGTFLLPWPGSEEPAMARGAATSTAVGADRCIDAVRSAAGVLQHCNQGVVRVDARDGIAAEPAVPAAEGCVSLRCGA